MSDLYRETFHKNGFVIIPNVISKEAVAALRAKYQEALAKYDLLTLKPTQFLNELEIAEAIFSPKVVSAIKEITQRDYTMYPDFSIRENLYIPWHTDASHLPEHHANGGGRADFIQCSIYLQENNKQSGGGLEVLPGSHLRKDIQRKKPAASRDINFDDASLLQSKAGDLVLWDSRIVHRSIKNETPEVPKLAIQWTVSATQDYAQNYKEYLKERVTKRSHVSDQGGNREAAFVSDIGNVAFPQSFPQPLVDAVNNQNINMVCL